MSNITYKLQQIEQTFTNESTSINLATEAERSSSFNTSTCYFDESPDQI